MTAAVRATMGIWLIFLSGEFLIILVASMPSITGMWRSISTPSKGRPRAVPVLGHQTVALETLAGVYGRYDQLRVKDRSAHQAITVLKTAVTPHFTDEFRSFLGSYLEGARLAELCAAGVGSVLGGSWAQVSILLGSTRAKVGETPPDDGVVAAWEERVREVAGLGDTLGGIVEIRATGVPAGLGEPVFDKLDARLAAALMSVGAVKGVEIGAGFAAARMLGSRNNDAMHAAGFASNNAGGILAGISSGQEIVVRAAIKPIPSIALEQHTVDRFGAERTIRVGGRHDICAIPRVVPVLAAMVRLVLADMVLLQRRMGQGG